MVLAALLLAGLLYAGSGLVVALSTASLVSALNALVAPHPVAVVALSALSRCGASVASWVVLGTAGAVRGWSAGSRGWPPSSW